MEYGTCNFCDYVGFIRKFHRVSAFLGGQWIFGDRLVCRRCEIEYNRGEAKARHAFDALVANFPVPVFNDILTVQALPKNEFDRSKFPIAYSESGGTFVITGSPNVIPANNRHHQKEPPGVAVPCSLPFESCLRTPVFVEFDSCQIPFCRCGRDVVFQLGLR